MNFDSGDFTISGWVKPRSCGFFSRIIDFATDVYAQDDVVLVYSSGNSCNPAGTIYAPQAENIVSNTTVTLSIWQHVAWVLRGNTVSLYLNGNLVARKNATILPRNVLRSGWVGGSYNNLASPANADLDDIKLFNIALNDNEIKNEYNL